MEKPKQKEAITEYNKSGKEGWKKGEGEKRDEQFMGNEERKERTKKRDKGHEGKQGNCKYISILLVAAAELKSSFIRQG